MINSKSTSNIRIILTEHYWDCECERDYIKPSSIEHCPRCDVIREDQPDSRLTEVIEMYEKQLKSLDFSIDVVDCFSVRDILYRDFVERELTMLYDNLDSDIERNPGMDYV